MEKTVGQKYGASVPLKGVFAFILVPIGPRFDWLTCSRRLKPSQGLVLKNVEKLGYSLADV